MWGFWLLFPYLKHWGVGGGGPELVVTLALTSFRSVLAEGLSLDRGCLFRADRVFRRKQANYFVAIGYLRAGQGVVLQEET